MSGTLGNLSVVLTLNDTGYTVGIQRATQATTALQGAVDSLNGTVAKSSIALGTASTAASQWGRTLASMATTATAAIQQASAAMQAQVAASQAATAAIQAQVAALTALKAANAGFGGAAGLPSGLSLGSLAGIAGGLLGVAVAGVEAREAFRAMADQVSSTIEAGDRMTISVSRLQSILGSTRAVAQDTYSLLEQSAEKTGIGVDELVKSFTGFDLALAGIGQNRQQVIDFTTTLSTLAHVSGTTGAAANRAFRELSEGLATGGVNLRQLKIIGQDMAPLLGALASSLHLTVGQLEELSHAGKLTTDIVVEAVSDMAGKVSAEFAQLPISLATARQDLTTATDQLRATLDQKLGLSQLLSGWDQGWANFFQTISNNVDTGLTASLARAKGQLVDLKALAAAGGNSPITSQFADPTAVSSLSVQGLQERIIATQKAITAMQALADKQTIADNATAASALKQHQLSDATDALSKAMETLGLAHEKTSPEIQTLSEAIARGQDITVPYNDTLLHASQLLDLLREKATPATQAIAALNEQLVKANAQSVGGMQAKVTDALIKADPADQTGQGVNLTTDQKTAIQTGINSLVVAEGTKDVQDAMNKMRLAQAAATGRSRDDHGLAESMERIRQQRQKFLSDHGNSPAAVSEADQITTADTTAARLTAQGASVKAAREGTNAVTELRARVAELQASIDGSGTAVAEWTQKLRTASPAIQANSTAILAQAAHLDTLKKQYEDVQKAMHAVDQIKTLSATATDHLDTMGAYSSTVPTTELQKEFIKNQQEVNRQINITKKALADGSLVPGTGNYMAAMNAVGSQQNTVNTLDMVSLRQLLDKDKEATLSDHVANKSSTGQGQLELQADDYDSQVKSILALTKQGTDQQKAMLADVATWNQTQQTKIANANKDQLAKTAAEWGDWQKSIAGDAGSLFDQVAGALQKTGAAGTKAWQDIGNSALKMVEDLTMKLAGGQLMSLMDQLWTGKSNGTSNGVGGTSASGLSGLQGLLSSGGSSLLGWLTGSGASLPAADSTGLSTGVEGGFYHSGGIVGPEATFMRNVSGSVFANATRYHTGGLAGNEVPTILQRGEGVFTKGQMAALGMQANTMSSMASAVANISQAQTAAPSDVSSPANYNYNMSGISSNVGASSSGSSGAGASGNVVVNLHNQTGTQQQAVAASPRFDGEKMVIDIVTKHASQPGPFRSALRGA